MVKCVVDYVVFFDGLRYVVIKVVFGEVYWDVVDMMENIIVWYSENIVNEIRVIDGEECEKVEVYFDVVV